MRQILYRSNSLILRQEADKKRDTPPKATKSLVFGSKKERCAFSTSHFKTQNAMDTHAPTFKNEAATWFEGLQTRICDAIAAADGKATFGVDAWQREGGGGGKTRVLQKGAILEKAGVGFSAVWGKAPEKMLQALRLEPADFFASGVSIVMHPHSPRVPIIHMNVRYFEMSNGVYWFGGGIDLTPHYIVPEDAIWFHEQLAQVCNRFDTSYYPKFKDWADDYFFLKHRNETRGIGGIFFDHLKEDATHSKAQIWEFVKAVGEAFAPIYSHLMLKNKDLPFGEKEKHWQMVRRGRYVEFNLVYDKGTKFGLDTNGRTESILMSMPPMAQWLYNYQPEADEEAQATLMLLKKGVNWLEKNVQKSHSLV
jgi:coproporphyrinogen III oxidase